jgi:hypothetical protein
LYDPKRNFGSQPPAPPFPGPALPQQPTPFMGRGSSRFRIPPGGL